MRPDPLIPNLAVVTDIRVDTPDVKTFRVVGLDGKKPFVHIPGQCAMLSVPGVGEALFSITSSPTLEEYVEFSIKKCGCVTEWLHAMEPGQQITVRGPYGNGFPVDTAFAGKDLLFIAGGIGLAPSTARARKRIWSTSRRSRTSGARRTASTSISPSTASSRSGTGTSASCRTTSRSSASRPTRPSSCAALPS